MPGGGWERLVEALGLTESNVDRNFVDGRKERFVCGADFGLRVEQDVAFLIGIELGAARCREATSVECVDDSAECVGSVVLDPGDL